jgi:uncharacterized protein
MMRYVVVDTNVVIAGLLTKDPSSPTAIIFEGMMDGEILYVLSPELLAEYRAVLLRPKLVALHGLSEQEIDEFLTHLTANAVWCEPSTQGIAPDSNDNHLWALMDERSDTLLITGDRLLLEKPHTEGGVVRPIEYVSGFKRG